ncbi:hypothetical protein ACSSS7_005057 [Eimeria intestinalis]
MQRAGSWGAPTRTAGGPLAPKLPPPPRFARPIDKGTKEAPRGLPTQRALFGGPPSRLYTTADQQQLSMHSDRGGPPGQLARTENLLYD